MSERKEIDAFFNFFASFDLARPVTTISDLADGAALFEVLSLVCVSVVSKSRERNWLLTRLCIQRCRIL